MQIEGKHVVVTGGASGIGRALARRFAAEGARGIVVADRDASGAKLVATEFGGLAAGTDVADESQVRELVASAEREYGPIDLFCSNAGIAVAGGVEVPDADILQDISRHDTRMHATSPGNVEMHAKPPGNFSRRMALKRNAQIEEGQDVRRETPEEIEPRPAKTRTPNMQQQGKL